MVLNFVVKKKILRLNSWNICYNAGLIIQQVENRYTWYIRFASLIFSKLFDICEGIVVFSMTMVCKRMTKSLDLR